MAWGINGNRTEKLLQRTLKSYILFSVLIFVLLVPLFYFVARYFYMENLDEILEDKHEEFIQKDLPKLSTKDIIYWNRYNADIRILPYHPLDDEVIFTKEYMSRIEDEEEPFRELNAVINIDQKPFVLSIRQSIIESEDLLTSIILLFFILLVLILIGFILLTRQFSRSLWKPFHQSLAEISSYEIDKPQSLHFPNTKITEFNQLNQSLENWIHKNKKIYDNQREFTENAAHELQTPIAVFKANVDNFMQRTDLTEEQADTLQILNNNIQKFSRLNKNLLLFSKLEHPNFSENKDISINEAILGLLPFYKTQATGKKLQIHTSLTSEIYVHANITLVEIMLNNLLMNAIKYNRPNGEVWIFIAKNSLRITNTSRYGTLNPDKIFERFYKSADTQNGNGLGLAIVKKIVDTNNWTIRYDYVDSTHVFTLHF